MWHAYWWWKFLYEGEKHSDIDCDHSINVNMLIEILQWNRPIVHLLRILWCFFPHVCVCVEIYCIFIMSTKVFAFPSDTKLIILDLNIFVHFTILHIRRKQFKSKTTKNVCKCNLPSFRYAMEELPPVAKWIAIWVDIKM